MHGHARRFADSHQARHNGFSIAVDERNNLAFVIRRNATHVVMHGRQHGNRVPGYIDAGENTRRLGNAGQLLFDHVRPQVLEMQVNMIAVLADAAALANFNRHRTTNNVARREILRIRRIAFHKSFAFGICQIATLAPHALGNQHSGPVNTGRMKLHEFHVLQRQSGA